MDSRDATEEPAAARHSTWHLHWQAAVGQTFLPNLTLAERIRGRLVAAHTRRGRVLVDYTILPTEIHLITCIAEGDTPGEVAGAIGNVIARWVREAGHVRSPVMGGPFHSRLIRSDEELRREIRMLAWRPVVLGLCRGPTFYPHSALRISLGLRPAGGFDARPKLRLFGDGTIKSRLVLSRWVSRRPTDLDWRSWELARGLALAPSHGGPEPAGFREVKTGEAAALVAMAGKGGVDAALGLLVDWVTWKIGTGGATDVRKGQDPQAVRGRAIVARLAVAHALCSAAFVARFFGKAKATLSEQVSASRVREADTRLVAMPMARILEEISMLKTAPGRRAGHEDRPAEHP